MHPLKSAALSRRTPISDICKGSYCWQKSERPIRAAYRVRNAAAYAVSEIPRLRAAPIMPASAIIVSTPTKPPSAKAIAPHSDSVREVCDAQPPDADAVRRSLLTHLGGRTQWQPRLRVQL